MEYNRRSRADVTTSVWEVQNGVAGFTASFVALAVFLVCISLYFLCHNAVCRFKIFPMFGRAQNDTFPYWQTLLLVEDSSV